MGNRIGDYIHYGVYDYLTYGINYSGGENNIYTDLASERKKAYAAARTLGDAKKAKDLQDKLNAFYGTSKTTQIPKDDMSILEKELYNSLSNITANINVISGELAGEYKNDLVGMKGETSSAIYDRVMKNKSRIKVDTLKKALKQLEIYLKNLKTSALVDSNGIIKDKELDKVYQNAKTQYDKVRNMFTEVRMQLKGGKEGYVENSMGGKGIYFDLTQEKNKDIKDFLQAFNDLRGYLSQTLRWVQGQLGENGTAGIVAALNVQSGQVLKDVLSELYTNKEVKNVGNISNLSLTGTQGTKKTLKQSNFYIDLSYEDDGKGNFVDQLNDLINENEQKFISYSRVIDDNGNVVALGKTADKIDVSFSLKDDDEEYNLSIKNYDLGTHSAITLHSGNFLRLVQDYTLFINHLLNVIPERESSPVNLSAYQSDIDYTLKSIVGTHGLVGGLNIEGGGISKKANYFVVNARGLEGGSQFKVYAMSTLANKIYKNPNSVVVFYKGVKPENIKNSWVEGPASASAGYSRARNMVLQLARVGIEAKIRKEALI